MIQITVDNQFLLRFFTADVQTTFRVPELGNAWPPFEAAQAVLYRQWESFRDPRLVLLDTKGVGYAIHRNEPTGFTITKRLLLFDFTNAGEGPCTPDYLGAALDRTPVDTARRSSLDFVEQRVLSVGPFTLGNRPNRQNIAIGIVLQLFGLFWPLNQDIRRARAQPE